MINELLQNKFSEKDFTEYVSSYLPDFSPVNSRTEQRRGFSAVKQIGECPSLDLVIFDVVPESSIHARMEISKQSYALIKNHPRAHALIAYHSHETSEWRLSLITTQVTRDKKGIKETVSNPRRFSYVLGPKAKVNTPTKYLIAKGKIVDLNDLRERFSLEVVNKDFYREISNLFTKLTGGTYINGKDRQEYVSLMQLPSVPEKDQKNLEFAVRLIGRVIFCWFLREKKSDAGLPLMPKQLLSLEAIINHTDFYHSILEPIFFEVLNKHVKSRKDLYAKEPFSSIPYLNGGLFAPDYDDFYSYNIDKQTIFHNTLIIPDDWIKEFFAFLETYNFTIDENVSFDEELSIDPEMLGRIFENLLAEINPNTGESARKSTGSYYTPRSIVDHMIDESLFNYLKESTKIDDHKLRAIISYDIEDDLLSPLTIDEYGRVVDSLATIKILDPACGSGAFPIGALQKIVFILQQVDPDGKKWFDKQIANAAPEIKRVIEREFANKNFNYIRKLGVIRDNIFGIDIQPIATEISRLRCFLTLIVDQSIHDNVDNRGIEPLPNLDFKFVTANTLIPLPGGNEQSLFRDRERIEQLKDLRNQFFSSTNSERNQLKLEFKELQNQMLDRMIEMRGGDDITRTLSRWDPFSHKVTPWFDSGWMFGLENGFDVVIANPPYVDSETMTRDNADIRDFYRELYKSAKGNWDLFVIFIERGFQLLRPNGVISYIVPNKLLGANYTKSLREILLKKQIKEVRDYSRVKVFKEVSVYPIVFVALNSQSKSNVLFTKMISETDIDTQHNIEGDIFYADINWDKYFLSKEKLDVILKLNSFRRLSTVAKQITDAATVSEAYEIKKSLTELTSIGTLSYKKLLNTGTIDPYTSFWGKQKTQYIKSSYLQPVIADEKIITLNPNRYRQACSMKIVISGMAKRIEGFYDDTGQYLAGKSTIVILDDKENQLPLKYLLSLMNSKLLSFWYMNSLSSLKMAGGYLNFSSKEIGTLPIAGASTANQEAIISLVDNILSLTKSENYAEDTEKQTKVREYQKQIDKCVYKLYSLTPEEVGVVEKEIL